jgi:hypothetical protein
MDADVVMNVFRLMLKMLPPWHHGLEAKRSQ